MTKSGSTFILLAIILIIHYGEPFFTNPIFSLSSSNGKFQLNSSKKNDDKSSNPKFLSIPVIGPIPSVPPLNIGGEYILDPPTPLQWKALQESIVIHKMSSADGITQKQVGTIKAAPIIAFIDEVTGSR